MPHLYEIVVDSETETVLEDMRKKIARNFGVTLQGNRLTLRWYIDNTCVSVHTIIEHVLTPSETQNLESDCNGEDK